jgi:ABC-2 type transport system permease protein
MVVSLTVTALSIARERELGTFDQLLVSPTTSTEIILAKTVPALLIGGTLGLLMVAAGIAGFRDPLPGFTPGPRRRHAPLHPLDRRGGVDDLRHQRHPTTGHPGRLRGRGAHDSHVRLRHPRGEYAPVLQWLAEGIPLKHFLIIVQGSFLKGMPPGEVWSHAWPLIIIALVTLGLATLLVRSRLQ